MKTFTLRCIEGHEFELMVKSADALAEQQARGLVTCPYCESSKVERTLATPAVVGGKGRGQKGRGQGGRGQGAPEGSLPVLSKAPDGPRSSRAEFERAYKFFAEMRTKVEKTHENVGVKFSDQARAMHYGEIEHRDIYGEASAGQVQDLLDEGVEIAPLPNLPKANA